MQECDKEVLLAEYQTLRGELAIHQQQIYRLYQLSMTGAVIVLAWGITQKSWLITLTPTPILVVSILLLLGEMESMFRISGYVQTFIEPRLPDLNWETRLTRIADKRGFAEQYQNSALALAYLLIAATSLSMSWVTAGNKSPISAGAARGFIGVVIVICVVVAAVAAYGIYKNRDLPNAAHMKIWTEQAELEWGRTPEALTESQPALEPAVVAVADDDPTWLPPAVN